MLALIPARGGSKGLPGKNIKPLLGKPLIAYTIEAAKASRYVDQIIVSTDDDAIAAVAQEHGAHIPFMRPASLAGDEARALDVYLYTIDRLEQERGIKIEEFVVLLPTVPLRSSADIDGAIELFRSKGADSVVSYTPEQHPISWHRYLDDELRFEDIFEPNKLLNRQELRKSYYPNGAIYVFKSSLIRQQKYYTAASYAYLMPRNRSVDIDSLEDFEYAEFLLKKHHSHEQ